MGNSKSEIRNDNNKKPKMSKNNRILTISVCVFLALVLVFGVVFGIITLIEEANTVMSLGGVRMSEGVVRVFASHYKNLHISSLRAAGYPDARDTEQFWESLHENGKTQGELFISSLESYISGIAAGVTLYKNNVAAKLSDADMEYVNSKINAFVSYYGGKEEFSAEMEKFGFTYEDFVKAMELSYTAEIAFYSIYGADGSGVKSSASMCLDYYSKYSRVKLLFLFDEKISEVNDEGEIVDRQLTEDEKAERRETADFLREAMRLAEEGESGAITDVTFDLYLEKSDGDPDMHVPGYYFYSAAEQTASFNEFYPDIVSASMEMNVGEYREVTFDGGTCFIYKCSLVQNAYDDEENPFFKDFYSDAALYFYTEAISELSEDANYKDSYYDIDLIAIPENDRIFVTSWN